jgi:hypothetical protein
VDRATTTEEPATSHGREFGLSPVQLMTLPVIPDLENQLDNLGDMCHSGPTIPSKVRIASLRSKRLWEKTRKLFHLVRPRPVTVNRTPIETRELAGTPSNTSIRQDLTDMNSTRNSEGHRSSEVSSRDGRYSSSVYYTGASMVDGSTIGGHPSSLYFSSTSLAEDSGGGHGGGHSGGGYHSSSTHLRGTSQGRIYRRSTYSLSVGADSSSSFGRYYQAEANQSGATRSPQSTETPDGGALIEVDEGGDGGGA